MSGSIVERVARAIAAVEGYDVDGLRAYATSSSVANADYERLLEKSRAAISEVLAGAISEDDVWLLASAVENLRGGSQSEEKRVEAAWRIAAKLEDLRKRIDAALSEQPA